MNSATLTIPAPVRHKKRSYLPEDFRVEGWESLEPWFEDLLRRPIHDTEDLLAWLDDRSELEAVTVEDASWRFIQTTRDTDNADFHRSYKDFVSSIKPEVSRYQNELDRKFIECPYVDSLDPAVFTPYVRKIRARIGLYRDENIPLITEETILSKKYQTITGRMTVTVNGEELTLPQAGLALSRPDREIREKVYLALTNRRLQDQLELDELFSDLVRIRHRIAVNAGFANYRDYKFAELHRFDYDPEDCEEFHHSILEEVMPLVRFLDLRKETVLDLGTLRPWDLKMVSTGRSPVRPFQNGDDMLEKGIAVFRRINPEFADYLATMRDSGYLDLESRIGKAPGGYNCPLPESGVPFIFMNASGSTRDVKTIMHEGGHAVHSFLSRDLRFTGFKEVPSEIAELASLAMEYFALHHLDEFYPDPEDLRLARIEHLERVVNLFPWVAAIDSFQHWVYTHPEHTVSERETAWIRIHDRFGSWEVDWTGLEHYRTSLWQGQLHLFKVPFYYIEYAIAQLGAIAMWRNYQDDPDRTLRQYRDALSLGYTRTIGQTYAAAGIRFDFSREYVAELMAFVRQELEDLFRD